MWRDAAGGSKKFEVGLSYIVGVGIPPTKTDLSPKLTRKPFEGEGGIIVFS